MHMSVQIQTTDILQFTYKQFFSLLIHFVSPCQRQAMLILKELCLEIRNIEAFLLLTLAGFVQAHRISPHPCKTTALVFLVIYASPDFACVNNYPEIAMVSMNR